MQNDLELLTGNIIGAAIAVHRELGAGLLESAYEACLRHELSSRGLHVERQKALPITGGSQSMVGSVGVS